MSKEKCLKCGCLTEHTFCPACQAAGQELIRAVQAFVKRYPGISVIELCRELRISLETVKGLVAKGYLNMDMPGELKTENIRETPEKQAEPEAQRVSGFHSVKKHR